MEEVTTSLLLQAMKAVAAAGALLEMAALFRPVEALVVVAVEVLAEMEEMSLYRLTIRSAAAAAVGVA
jgi:hypothetical protein